MVDGAAPFESYQIRTYRMKNASYLLHIDDKLPKQLPSIPPGATSAPLIWALTQGANIFDGHVSCNLEGGIPRYTLVLGSELLADQQIARAILSNLAGTVDP